MAKQKIAPFFLAIVLILGAKISYSSASFPTLLTHDHRKNSRRTNLIGWPAPSPPSSDEGIKGGYWPSWLAYSFPPSSIPTSYFTHVFYAFIGIDASTYNLTITQPDDEWMGNFTATLHSKKPPAKSMLSIGGANSGSGTFSTMISDPKNRATFIKSSIATARKYGFDGMDIDWEFPGNQNDMSNLALLFKEWRLGAESEANKSGKPRLLISAAVYFASMVLLDQPPATYPGEAIGKYADFINPMCFDYHGSWNLSVTGEHALLFDKSSNISTSYGILSWIKIGVPPNKLVMGMPLYGRSWELKDPKKHGIGAPAKGVGPGNDGYGVMFYDHIVEFNAQHHAHQVYDEMTVSEYSYSGTDWIGYDGPTSVKKKVEWAKANHLGGYFFWALGYDSNWTLSAIGKFNHWAVSSFHLGIQLQN
ncbi:hypothetical protein COLO4_18739 [Corchorus olitorius]|uniref:GH18 domain-containing protein n=1 Tax=Corchorus olitorius TaxID=93759 RepID=A0A1R3J853_9ROSI|nr:hypothetical protein COLO4_18739 [Corchorus olitorius]